MKSKFTIAGIIILGLLVVFNVLAIFISYGMASTYVHSTAGYEADNVALLWYEDTFERDGKFYSISKRDDTETYIAFVNDEDEFDMLYAAGSYYPDNYWNGKGEVMDFSQDYLEKNQFAERDDSSRVILDISEFEDEKSYLISSNSNGGFYTGEIIKEAYKGLSHTTVYDVSDFVGAEKPQNSKAFIAMFGVAGAFGLIFMWDIIGVIIATTFMIIGVVRSSKKKKKAVNS